MTDVCLTRLDASQNMARYYRYDRPAYTFWRMVFSSGVGTDWAWRDRSGWFPIIRKARPPKL